MSDEPLTESHECTPTDLTVTIPAHLSHTGNERETIKPIDGCIAPIVQALNAAGITTWSSCCGHGHGPGNIILADGRTLTIEGNHA